MQEDHTLKFLVSVFTAGIIALLNLAVLGQVHWGWILAALLGAFLLLELYQRLRRPKPPAQPKPKRKRRRRKEEAYEEELG
jgi:O-antigen/teichoic acid export membrane protein